jgi:uncharacterized membrane protein SpoIIM required for sporulation
MNPAPPTPGIEWGEERQAMLETVLIGSHKQEKLTVFMGAVFFTALSLAAARFLIPFQVGGYNLAGLIAVLVAAVALAYPLSTYMRETRAEEEAQHLLAEKTLLQRHLHEVEVYLSFFAGSFLTFAAATYLFTPGFFDVQHAVISGLNAAATGNAVFSGADLSQFLVIAANNLRLFYVTFLLTFFISGGMVFILVWNASVFGVFLASAADSISSFPGTTLLYVPHGTLEVAGYIAAGVAGIIFSREIEAFFVEQNSDRDVYFRVWKDVWILLGLGSVTIVLAGFIETL